MDNPEFYEPDAPQVDEDPFAPENGRFPSPSSPETTSLSAIDPEPPPKKRHGCWLAGIAGLVIFSMLAFGLASLFQFGQEAAAHWTVPWATPTPSLAEAGRIAYIGENGQIFTVQPDGKNGRQLTDDEFSYQFPAWAPQGNQLAALGGGSVIQLTDEANTALKSLYEGGVETPFYLYWSPDSSQISFLANSQRGISLRVVSTSDDSGDAEIRGFGTPFYWNWLDDNAQMLVHSGAGGSAQLGLLQADGELEEIAPPGAFQAPGISANGRYWAYAQNMGDGNSALVITDTEKSEQWSERHPAVAAMSWSPAADQLAFSTGIQDRNAFWGPLRLFDTETRKVSLLSDNTVLAFFWSPNGRYLATFNTGDLEQDFGVNVAYRGKPNRAVQAKPVSQIVNPHQFNLAIIDVETGEETQVMSFFPTGIFITQFLPYFDQYALSHSIWSPNSDAIVLPMHEEGENHVKVVRIDGSEVIDLGLGDMAFWSR